MELKISKNNLFKITTLAERISGKNLNLPILNSFLISSQKGKIKISSTNLEIGFEIYAPAQIIQEGKVVIPAKIMNNLVSNIKDDVIQLKQEGINLKITTNSASIILKTNSLDDFPIMPQIKKEFFFKIKTTDLLSGIKSTVFAASLSNFKPELASVYFYNIKEEYVFVATDSFRLMEKKISNKENKNQQEFSLLLPIKTSFELMRILEDLNKEEENDLEICYNKNEFQVSNGDFTFFSRLTDGTFVNYAQFMPKVFLGEIVVDNKELISVLKTASIFLSRLNDVVLEVNLKNNVFELKTSNPELGEFSSVLKMTKRGFDNIKQEKIKLTFNLKYLLEGINQINSAFLILKFSEEGKPLMIQGDDDKNSSYLVMPMKL